jgi:CRISPR/Cas system type I-B associated protein Csh2 (Cas7 group RAMP superfamily)
MAKKEKGYRKTAGRVHGPVQVTMGESIHPVDVLTIGITRCCATNEKDSEKERTMGGKFIIPYALYRFHIYVSTVDAQKTGFSKSDLSVFENALVGLVNEDRSSSRGELTVRGIYRFSHQSPYGNAPAHELFDHIRIQAAEGVVLPQAFSDYVVSVDRNMPEGVELSEIKVESAINNNSEPLSGRVEYVFLLDVRNGNPNGDPDAGGRPRVIPKTLKGLITDVCLKRKIRNYVVARFGGGGDKADTGKKIFFMEGNLLNDLIEVPYETDKYVKAAFEEKKKGTKGTKVEELAQKVLCQQYYDIRTFGAVLSTGDKSTGETAEATEE